MINFNYLASTKIYFGKDEEKNVGRYIKERGFKKVLFHYGMNSIKRSGLYDSVIKSLKENDLEYVELGGVEANPTSLLANEGVKLARKENVDFILAVGGGSVIDSSKAIAHGVFYQGDVFDFNLNKIIPLKSLPFGVILTISAAGSEMSTSCVLQDTETKVKKGFNSETNRPLFAIENPYLTFSVPLNQTGYGVVDIIAHTLERYFNKSDELEFADYLAEGLLRAVIDAGYVVSKKLDSYDARATLMVASSYSHNGLTGLGKVFSFPIHQLEHQISGIRKDISHGGGLACLIPSWMKVIYPYDKEKFKRFALEVCKVENIGADEEIILKGINKLEELFSLFKIPLKLSEYNISKEDIEFMVNRLPEVINSNIPLTRALAREIYNLAM